MKIETGYRFGNYNCNSKGTVISATSQNVSYTFDHDLEKVWDRERKDFEKNTFPLEAKPAVITDLPTEEPSIARAA